MKFIEKYRKILIIIVLVLIALVGGSLLTAYFKIKSLLDSAQKIEDVNMPELENNNISPEAQEDMEGYWTIALFGLDSRDGDLGKGNNSDVEMICSINRATGEIRLVSVYRDTYLKVGKNKYNKINSAYTSGGPSQAITALSENLDMSFDDYASFNWKAVAEAINILGGIDIEITKDEFKLINGFITETVKSTGIGSHHLKSSGMNHLDGVQAVAYARLRKMDTDFQRTERQRTVLSKAMEKAKKADFSVLNNVLVVVLEDISTSIDMNDVIPMAKNISRYHLGKTTGFPFKHYEKDIGALDCVIPNTLESNVADLHKFLYDKPYTPSKHVREISEKIIADSKNASGSKKKTTKAATKEEATQESPDEPETLESLEPESEDTLQPTGVEGGPGVIITRPPASSTEGESQPGPGETTPGETLSPESTLPQSETEEANRVVGGPGETSGLTEGASTTVPESGGSAEAVQESLPPSTSVSGTEPAGSEGNHTGVPSAAAAGEPGPGQEGTAAPQ